MKLKYATIPFLLAALSGCNTSTNDVDPVINDTVEKPNDESAQSPSPSKPPSSFNLTEITAKDTSTLSFSWSGDTAGNTYSVCLKDSALPDGCNAKATITDRNTVDVTGISVFEAAVSDFFILAENEVGKTLSSELGVEKAVSQSLVEYIKASNTGDSDEFGYSISLSGDGSVLAVGSYAESSSSTGVNGDESNDSASRSGAVYVFRSDGSEWIQEAYVKASNTDAGDEFGYSVSLSGDGSVLAVGAYLEDSGSVGVNGNESDNTADASGAAYVFRYDGSNWAQEAYIKPTNTDDGDTFGKSIHLSDDGLTLAVGASNEDSSSTGVNGSWFNNSSSNSGAAYIFRYNSGSWLQEAYVKASNADNLDTFGDSVALNGDGSVLVVGADMERSSSTGVNGDGTSNHMGMAGAAYIFRHDGANWSQEAYVKASNTGGNDLFGRYVTISRDGSVVAVSAYQEGSGATGVNGDELDHTSFGSGAVYVFRYDGSDWAQEAYVKASNTGDGDRFGSSLRLSGDGSVLVVGAPYEDSDAEGLGGDEANDLEVSAGAVYVFRYDGSNWAQEAYVKAPNAVGSDRLGVSVSLSDDASILVAGAHREDSGATGSNGNAVDESVSNSGAVYIYD